MSKVMVIVVLLAVLIGVSLYQDELKQFAKVQTSPQVQQYEEGQSSLNHLIKNPTILVQKEHGLNTSSLEGMMADWVTLRQKKAQRRVHIEPVFRSHDRWIIYVEESTNTLRPTDVVAYTLLVNFQVSWSNSDDVRLVFNSRSVDPAWLQDLSENEHQVYTDVLKVLNGEVDDVYIMLGRLEQGKDYNGDAVNDFLIHNQRSYNMWLERSTRLITFDGHRQLMVEPMIATSAFESGVCDEFSGFRESFVTSHAHAGITISHTVNDYRQGCALFRQFHYEKVWRDGELYLNTPLFAKDDAFLSLVTTFHFLEERDEAYVLQPSCHMNEPVSWGLEKKMTSSDTFIYRVIGQPSNGVYYFVVGVEHVGTNQTNLSLMPMDSLDETAVRDISLFLGQGNTDMYQLLMGGDKQRQWATSNASIYDTVPCL